MVGMSACQGARGTKAERAGVCIWGDRGKEEEGGEAKGEMQQEQQQQQLSLPVPPFVLP